ncbi:MAG: HAD family hydrolase [Alphaproteobacteria bacterium]
MASPGLVIFDCDGVLVDSEPLANASLAEGLQELGLAATPEETHSRYLGLSWTSVIADLEVRYGGPLPDGWLERVQARDRDLFRRHLKPIPGVEAVVARLRRLRVPYCVASSGSPDKMKLTLGVTGLLTYFQGVMFSSTMVERGKPHPDLFQLAAERMGARPKDTTVIEDSLNGVKAAAAAGMTVLAFVRDPLSDREALAAAGGRLFETMDDLPALLALA